MSEALRGEDTCPRFSAHGLPASCASQEVWTGGWANTTREGEHTGKATHRPRSDHQVFAQGGPSTQIRVCSLPGEHLPIPSTQSMHTPIHKPSLTDPRLQRHCTSSTGPQAGPAKQPQGPSLQHPLTELPPTAWELPEGQTGSHRSVTPVPASGPYMAHNRYLTDV